MLEAAPPPMHALLSHRGNQDRPGWEASAARGEEEGRTACIIRGGGGGGQTGRKANQSHPPNCFTSPVQDWRCHSSASSLGERRHRNMEGHFRGRGDTRMALLPLPLPALLKAREDSSWPVSTPIALRGLEAFLALNWGVAEILRGESPPSPAPLPAPSPPGQLPLMGHPVACFPKASQT